jgi:hypothetical protein
MYQALTDTRTNQPAQGIKRIADNAFIPFDDANTDFVEYKKWLDAGGIVLAADAAPVAEGNTPEPADEVGNG